jgi:hypothetical protein
MSYTREETRDALQCNISDAAFRIKNSSEERISARYGLNSKMFKVYIEPEGGYINFGSKVSNKILTYVLAGLFY